MTKYHVVISIQWATSDGFGNFTREATIPVQDGTTRQHVFRQVRAAVEDAVGVPRDQSTVLFFDCHPDELAGGQS